MGATGIEWTKGPGGEPGFTFNPWIGCTKISRACDFCYAEGAAVKLNVTWGPHADRRPVSESTWDAPKAWNRKAAREGRRYRVFCASMADVLDNHRSIRPEWRSWLYELIFNTPHLDWLLLTKRPENGPRFLPARWFEANGWPDNVWFGITAEDQRRLDHAMEHALNFPAPVRYLSVEPMLEPLVLPGNAAAYFDWIIAGGESGRLADIRDTPDEWFVSLMMQCQQRDVGYFQKQLSQLRHRRDYKRFEAFPPALQIRQQPDPKRYLSPSVERLVNGTL